MGVTITMHDELLNGTNRVVLDGVTTEKECERILQLANVGPPRRRVRLSIKKKTGVTYHFVFVFHRLQHQQGTVTADDGLRTRLMRRLRA